MQLNTLTAISPIDGRYRNQLADMAGYFSEYGLMRYRVQVEAEYFLLLAERGIFTLPAAITPEQVRNIYLQFTEADAQAVKDIERTTNHDVKAVEYFLKNRLSALGGSEVAEWVHFGLTSQDINNTAVPLLWKEALFTYINFLDEVIEQLEGMAEQWNDVPMLARTHGQPASPTRLGKEIKVFTERLYGQLMLLHPIPFSAKFGGATGNFNAHHAAFPEIDWVEFANALVGSVLKLQRTEYTTQIEPYDNLAAQFDALKRINTILIDMCRDMWQYISMDYFRQQLKEGEVGSSAMPHKVNPIDFENAEGNLGIANAIYEHLSAKLPISRLQRDLTDSTVLRNIGVPFCHSYLAVKSIAKGLSKLQLNNDKLHADLEANWPVVAEALQTILRREGYEKPYEALKALTRGRHAITAADIHAFIDTLHVSEVVKTELKAITPHSYVGV